MVGLMMVLMMVLMAMDSTPALRATVLPAPGAAAVAGRHRVGGLRGGYAAFAFCHRAGGRPADPCRYSFGF